MKLAPKLESVYFEVLTSSPLSSMAVWPSSRKYNFGLITLVAATPSIWLTFTEPNKSSTLISGFYRQWSSNGDNSDAKQTEQINYYYFY